MPGWESLVRVQASKAWGSVYKASDVPGFFLDVDSITPDLGDEFQERDGKLSGNRESPNSSWSVDSQQPKCSLTFQPRVDDVLMFLMAYFQHCVVSSATPTADGTYVFSKIETNPVWTTGGMNFGTNVYGINLDIAYGQSFNNSGTQANGIRLMNGIVDKLDFNLKYGEDLQLSVDMKFLTGSRYQYPSTFKDLSTYGSYSRSPRLVDYQGTITTGTESLELDSFSLSLNNNTGDKTKIGQRGFSRFPFMNRMKVEGQLDLELARDINAFNPGSPWNVGGTVFSSGTNYMIISMPNAILKPTTIPINGGEGMISFNLPFRAYPASTGTTAISITVVCGSSYGTSLLGFGSLCVTGSAVATW